jgi:hypothetical protein
MPGCGRKSGSLPLASTPATGLRVQAFGDAHLVNFGAFATPERREIFDVNDLDETLPAPLGVGREAPRRQLHPGLSLAGVAVWAVMVPEGMAYSGIVGVPPIMGLYTVIPPLLVYALLGTSRVLVVGPAEARTVAWWLLPRRETSHQRTASVKDVIRRARTPRLHARAGSG